MQAYKEVQTVRNTLESVWSAIDVKHREWFEKAREMAALVNVQPATPRMCVHQQHRDSHEADSPEEYFRRIVTIPMLDILLEQLQQRFGGLQQVAVKGIWRLPWRSSGRTGCHSCTGKWVRAVLAKSQERPRRQAWYVGGALVSTWRQANYLSRSAGNFVQAQLARHLPPLSSYVHSAIHQLRARALCKLSAPSKDVSAQHHWWGDAHCPGAPQSPLWPRYRRGRSHWEICCSSSSHNDIIAVGIENSSCCLGLACSPCSGSKFS